MNEMSESAHRENILSRMEAANKLMSKSLEDIRKAAYNEAIEDAANLFVQDKDDAAYVRKLKKE